MEYSFWTHAALCAAAYYAVSLFLQRSTNLPPSPPRNFVLGHALKIPRTHQWKTFAEWGKSYGPVVYAQVPGRSIIIINCVSAAHDLMEKRSANFSDRPAMPCLDLIGWGVTLPLLQYGSAQYNKHRRWAQRYLGSSAIQSFNGIQEDGTHKFLQRLLNDPEGFYDHIHGHIASISVQAVYGHELSGDPLEYTLIKQTEEALRLTTDTGALGGTFMDLFPFLRHVPAWFPGMELKRKTLRIRRIVDAVFSSPFEDMKMKKAAGTAPPSITYQQLDYLESAGTVSPQDEVDVMNLGATFYNAGTDTIKTSLQVFFLMMVFHPDVQKRGQEEIRTAIGLDRLPLLSDRPDLPYIDCIVKEVLRINPPLPLGIPHQSIRTDEYNGWMVPAHSMIIPNIWWMMRDENHFPAPEKFDPSRHVLRAKHNGAGDLDTAEDPISPVFGFGRRACPGRALAESIIWLTIANVLASFDILPCKDPITGEALFPAVEYESEIVNHVKRFKCCIVPREEMRAFITGDT